jgi:transcriptional regulator with XRE-family HTH domain/CheY-like chemotaxis protein
MFASGFGAAVRRAREELGLSRKELARRAGLSYSYLSELENGAKSASSETYLAIAEALGMRPSQLVARSEGPLDYGRLSLALGDGKPDVEAVIADEFSALGDSRLPLAITTKLTEPASPSLPAEPGELPAALVRAIERGNCVAFVGTGFSAASGLPDWGTLLGRVAAGAGVSESGRYYVESRISMGNAHAFEEAAQVLEDQLGRQNLLEQLRAELGSSRDSGAMQRRLEWMHGIPFHSILTTGVDGSLPGALPSEQSYRAVLQRETHGCWSQQFWSSGSGAFTLKLHGDLCQRDAAQQNVILTRRDSRRRLIEEPAYRIFLGSVMATHTVLYMGFSFADAYLNELRSQVLALLGPQPEGAPAAYAIANDVPPETQVQLRINQGIEILPYDSRGGTDHSGFDEYLAEIHRRTNPLLRFARRLQSKRILWVDPHPQNNEPAFAQLAQAAQESGVEACLTTAGSAQEGLSQLQQSSPGFDLVITHWGEDAAVDANGQPIPTAIRLLTGIRDHDLRCPVIVFASSQDADQRKYTALGLGAQDYCFQFDRLYEVIERVLAPAQQTG